MTGAGFRFRGAVGEGSSMGWTLLLLLRTSPCVSNPGIDLGKASSPKFHCGWKQRDLVTKGKRDPTNNDILERRKRPRESEKIYKGVGPSPNKSIYTHAHTNIVSWVYLMEYIASSSQMEILHREMLQWSLKEKTAELWKGWVSWLLCPRKECQCFSWGLLRSLEAGTSSLTQQVWLLDSYTPFLLPSPVVYQRVLKSEFLFSEKARIYLVSCVHCISNDFTVQPQWKMPQGKVPVGTPGDRTVPTALPLFLTAWCCHCLRSWGKFHVTHPTTGTEAPHHPHTSAGKLLFHLIWWRHGSWFPNST